MNREEWLAERRNLITASDVAAVMGLDPHKSREKVLKLKTGQLPEDNIDRVPAVAAGRHLEAGILAWFAEGHENEYDRVRQNGSNLVTSKTLPYLAATPDGYAEGPDAHLVEVKCVDKPWTDLGKYAAPEPLSVVNVGRNATGATAPLKYWVQLQVQLHCTGLTAGWLTALQGAHSRADRMYRLDLAFETRMLDAVSKFWQDVLAYRRFDLEG